MRHTAAANQPNGGPDPPPNLLQPFPLAALPLIASPPDQGWGWLTSHSQPPHPRLPSWLQFGPQSGRGPVSQPPILFPLLTRWIWWEPRWKQVLVWKYLYLIFIKKGYIFRYFESYWQLFSECCKKVPLFLMKEEKSHSNCCFLSFLCLVYNFFPFCLNF